MPFAVGAPAMAPMQAPSAAPAPAESFSFTVRLNFATVAQFDPLRGAWCAQLTKAYPTSTCSISNVYLGSVYVDTNMTFASGDPSANTMLAELRDPTANSALFSDPQFGKVTVTSAGGTTVDAGVCSYQSPSMQSPGPMLAMLALPVKLEAALNCAHDLPELLHQLHGLHEMQVSFQQMAIHECPLS